MLDLLSMHKPLPLPPRHDVPVESAEHAWMPPQSGDVRSPCPALNTLANHGYLHRNGRNITLGELVRACVSLFNVSIPASMAIAGGGVLFLGHGGLGLGGLFERKLDLDELNRPGFLEHDASLSRRDFCMGDNHSPNADYIDQIIKSASGLTIPRQLSTDLPSEGKGVGIIQAITLRDLAAIRVIRETGDDHNPAVELNTFRTKVAGGESAIALLAFGTSIVGDLKTRDEEVEEGEKRKKRHGEKYLPSIQRVIPIDVFESFFRYERFPDGWTPAQFNNGPCGFKEMGEVTAEVGTEVARIRAAYGLTERRTWRFTY